MWFLNAVVCTTFLCSGVSGETWRLKDADGWESVAGDPEEQYRHAIAELKELVRSGDSGSVKELLEQLKDEFPHRAGPDLELFVAGELQYWKNRFSKALVKFEKLLKDYPGSEYAEPTLDREFSMAQEYLQGRKKTVFGILKLSGYAEGIEIMERISDRAGLDEPNSVGLRAAVAVAEHYEQRSKYMEAYLKWAEIASYNEAGLIGQRALYRMAENNLAAYNQPAQKRRPHLDAAKLTSARTYYEKFLTLYPKEAGKREIPAKIKQIDEQMAYKQFIIGQYYRRTGKAQAANLYFDMVVQNWPETAAAEMAKEALGESPGREGPVGK